MTELISIKSSRLPLIEDQSEGSEARMFGSFEYVFFSNKKPALPLAKVSVEANVIERLASVKVVQTFINLLQEPIEAVYIFPLAGTSAVSKFQMKIGQRTVDGVVKERSQARRQYRQAVSDGKRAAILEQERDDVFTAQVGNILPGEEITVTIIYSERLTYFDNGQTELRLPLVVAPRFMAGQAIARDPVGLGVEADTTAVPDASRISPPRLVRDFDPQIDLSLTVNLELTEESEILDLSCSQHAVKSTFKKHGITISLARDNELLNRDFVLSWRLAHGAISSLGLLSRLPYDLGGEKYNYGMVSINPPAQSESETYLAPRDIVFLLDRSGSMEGVKMSSATRALSMLLNTLTPRDRFSICAFDDRVEWFTDARNCDADNFFPASLKMLEKGQTFLQAISARGGTVMHSALLEVGRLIGARRKKKRQAVVIVITDGEIGNESQVFQYVQTKMSDSRVFSVGIDTAVNDGFLKRLANLGGGTCSLVTPGEALEEALIHVSREIGLPLVTDLHFDDQLLCPTEKSQDLFEGRPVSLFFRIKHGAEMPKQIKVSGKIVQKTKSADGKDNFSQVIDLILTENDALPQLYARTRVAALEDQIRAAKSPDLALLQEEIVTLAIAHGLLTRFTAFVAVDDEIVAVGDPRQLIQPVEVPDQWQLPMEDACRGLGYGAPQACQPASAPVMFGLPSESGLRKSAAWSAPAPEFLPTLEPLLQPLLEPLLAPLPGSAPAFASVANFAPGPNLVFSQVDVYTLAALLDKLEAVLAAILEKAKSISQVELPPDKILEREFAALQLMQNVLNAFVTQSALALEMVTFVRMVKWDVANLVQSLEKKLETSQVIVLATACGERLEEVKEELGRFDTGSKVACGQKKKTQEHDRFWSENV